MREVIEVRSARATDLPAVATLAVRGRDEAPAGAQVTVGDVDRLAEQLSLLLAVEGHILVAELGGEIVGAILGRVVGPHLFMTHHVLYLDTVFVSPEARRRGVGHALLRAVATLAVEHHCDEVYAAPVAGTRGVQRFLARLGFVPACGHRVVPTQTLVRELDDERANSSVRPEPHRRPRRRGLEHLIATRRRARATGTGPIDLRAVSSERVVG